MRQMVEALWLVLLAWLPAVLWIGVIYLFSDQPYSGELSERYLGVWNIAVRKIAHLTEYAILFLLLHKALLAGPPASAPAGSAPPPRLGSAGKSYSGLRALTLATAYALADEWHQACVPGRTGTGLDVFVDSAGGCLGWAAWYLISRAPRAPAG